MSRLGRPRLHLRSIGSTNARARELAQAGAPHGTAVTADEQTAGRGRQGRGWSTPPGSALALSLVIRDPDPLLSLRAGLAVADLAGAGALVKWPNDVLVDGRKAAGILAESSVADGRFEHVVLGIGANLGEPPPDVPSAGAVRADAAELLGGFLSAFVRAYRPRDADFANAVTAAHAAVSATLGTSVRAAIGGGAVVEGEAVSLDERGGLVVRTASGEQVVRFGEVEHLE